jgi:hypothetical protein
MAWEKNYDTIRHMEESSGVLFFRIVVMLSCLILVPLAAIFGSAFPDVVKAHLVDRIKSLAGMDNAPSASPAVAVETSRTSSADSAEAPRWSTAEAAPAWQPAVLPATAHQVDYTAPAPKYETPSLSPSKPVPQVVDHFTEIQQRLREYGASHYALESIQGDVGTYRFQCTMTLPGTANSQNFEATDRDPLHAMADVLAQVDAWRNNISAPSAQRRW